MLRKKLQEDQIQALKTKNQEKLEVLRFLISAIKNKEIEKKSELNDEEIILVIKKIVKEIKESIEAFKKGQRSDLVEKNKKQLEILSFYLPKELSDEELKKEIEKIIQENKNLYEKNPKAIIGVCMKTLKTKADSSRILKILNPFLQN